MPAGKDTEAVSLMQSFNYIDIQELSEDNGALDHDDGEWHQETARATNDIHIRPSEMLQRRDWHLGRSIQEWAK